MLNGLLLFWPFHSAVELFLSSVEQVVENEKKKKTTNKEEKRNKKPRHYNRDSEPPENPNALSLSTCNCIDISPATQILPPLQVYQKNSLPDESDLFLIPNATTFAPAAASPCPTPSGCRPPRLCKPNTRSIVVQRSLRSQSQSLR